MLDLKSCPFCGGAAELSVRGMTAVSHAADLKYYAVVNCPSCEASVCGEATADEDEAQPLAITAWNRRALQAVGPEPAVAVNPAVKDDETVVEALLNERQKRAEQVHDRILTARDDIRANLSPNSPEWLRDAFNKLHEAHHIMGGDPFDMHMRAALAAKDGRS